MYALTLAVTALLGLANATQMQTSAKFLNAPAGGRLAMTLLGTNFNDCALGVDGSLWATRKASPEEITYYNWATQSWVDDPSARLRRVSVDGNGNPWGINSAGNVFYGTPSGSAWSWNYVPGIVGTDIGAQGARNVYVLSSGGVINKLNADNTWSVVPGATGDAITVQPNGLPAVGRVGGPIQKLTPGGWVTVPGCARDISVAADGGLWTINCDAPNTAGDYAMYRYTGNSAGTPLDGWSYRVSALNEISACFTTVSGGLFITHI